MVVEEEEIGSRNWSVCVIKTTVIMIDYDDFSYLNNYIWYNRTYTPSPKNNVFWDRSLNDTSLSLIVGSCMWVQLAYSIWMWFESLVRIVSVVNCAPFVAFCRDDCSLLSFIVAFQW